LGHIEALLPISGAILAGTYGVELRRWDGKKTQQVSKEMARTHLDAIKTRWEDLLQDTVGFYLEDKGFAIALHGRHANHSDDQVNQIIYRARNAAEDELKSDDFQILGGYKFLEVAPRIADKGKTVRYLLQRYPVENSIPIYIGDDDKDERAFEAVRAEGGIAILVAMRPRDSKATYRLRTPVAVHEWLSELLVCWDD
jgi:alpha,alpha-trehalase